MASSWKLRARHKSDDETNMTSTTIQREQARFDWIGWAGARKGASHDVVVRIGNVLGGDMSFRAGNNYFA